MAMTDSMTSTMGLEALFLFPKRHKRDCCAVARTPCADRESGDQDGFRRHGRILSPAAANASLALTTTSQKIRWCAVYRIQKPGDSSNGKSTKGSADVEVLKGAAAGAPFWLRSQLAKSQQPEQRGAQAPSGRLSRATLALARPAPTRIIENPGSEFRVDVIKTHQHRDLGSNPDPVRNRCRVPDQLRR